VDERLVIVIFLAVMVIAIPALGSTISTIVDVRLDTVITVSGTVPPTRVILVDSDLTALALKEVILIVGLPEFRLTTFTVVLPFYVKCCGEQC
jgi:hypothetical protein